MNLTVEQLAYVLHRKYQNINPNTDYSLEETMSEDSSNETGWISNGDARIVEWKIETVKQPTESELKKAWEILEPQYNADPTLSDSKLAKYLRRRNQKNVVVNEDL